MAETQTSADARRFGPCYREQAALPDGTQVFLRPLERTDGPLLVEGMEELSPRSRYLRFLTPKERLTPEEMRHLLSVDQEEHVALIAFVGDAIAAVGRFVRIVGQPGTAEFAVTVVDRLQRRGLGTMLLARLKLAALERGIQRLTGYILLENQAMVRLLRKFGGRTGLPSWGLYEAELPLT
jgi:acetyltransferase